MNERNVKIKKGSHASRGYASIYIVNILNSFNLQLQLKDTESAMKNKLIDLLSVLRAIKFVTSLVLEFKK